MKDWQRYYDDENKERLLNVISLEFSHTRLENYVQAPRIVRLIDWVDTVWPRHLKDQQVTIEIDNIISDVKILTHLICDKPMMFVLKLKRNGDAMASSLSDRYTDVYTDLYHMWCVTVFKDIPKTVLVYLLKISVLLSPWLPCCKRFMNVLLPCMPCAYTCRRSL